MLSSLRKFTGSEVAQERLRIIEFYKQYGEQATKEAFGANRKVISRWRKKLRRHEGAIEGLVPESTRPKRVRTSNIAPEIVQCIRQLRQEYPRLGKEKIKPLLDEFCMDKGVKNIAESTIGKVIKRNKLFYQKTGRIYHDPSIKRQATVKRLRVKRSPRHEDFGHIISDTVHRVTDGVKDYFYNAIDAKLKFALTLNYKRLTSRNMKDFYKRFRASIHFRSRTGKMIMVRRIKGNSTQHYGRSRSPICLVIPDVPKSTASLSATTERSKKSSLTTTWTSFMTNHCFTSTWQNIWSSTIPREFTSLLGR